MDRKHFLQTLGIFASGALSAGSLTRAFSKLQAGSFVPLRNNIGYFTGQGGTIGWFASGDYLTAVDSQFPDSAADFINGIADFGEGPSRLLFNTHHHGDHTGGNAAFKEMNYQIIAHENVPGLQQGSGNTAAIDTTFADQFSADAGSERITARHYSPAHTGGDAVIWFEEGNIAHMGDLVFNRLYPFIDLRGGGSVRGWIATLESVVSEADGDTLFIYGHAGSGFDVTGGAADLLYMRDFLSKLLDHVSEGLAQNQSREEITAVEQFSEFPDHQSAGDNLSLKANLNAAFDELTSQ